MERAARYRMALASVLLMQALLACAGGKAGRSESSAASASGSIPLSLPPSFQDTGQANLAGTSCSRVPASGLLCVCVCVFVRLA